ncbi:uncharacterized protein LOC144007805 isoform X3 [Festucalex cinctus]
MAATRWRRQAWRFLRLEEEPKGMKKGTILQVKNQATQKVLAPDLVRRIKRNWTRVINEYSGHWKCWHLKVVVGWQWSGMFREAPRTSGLMSGG